MFFSISLNFIFSSCFIFQPLGQMFLFNPLEQFSIELYSSYLLQNIGVLSATSLSKIILFNFLLVIFCLYSVKYVFICNKFQKLVILLFNFVCINVKKFVSC